MAVTALVLAGAVTATPASAVNADHGNQVVSAVPASNTPHVMNGSVNAITQVGSKVVAGGTFTSVSPSGTYTNTADDVVRNGIFAFDATTGVIDPSFNPNLGGAVNSLSTDGTSVYAGGSFGSVGGSTAIKRLVKLTSAGSVVPGFSAVPSSSVNEVVYSKGRVFIGGGFKTVKSGTVTSTRAALAALDPTTGSVLGSVNVPFTGVYDPALGGTTNVKRFDVSPDGSRLAAIGNFSTVGGLPRSQLAVLNTPTTGNASVSTWATNRYDAAHNDCSSSFDTFTRDIDFSPDGSYFVVSATGAFAGGAAKGTMCDTTSRWETASTGNDPTWIDYTGGDTTYGVAITGAAVYVGGHMRWQNNPFQGDQAGPGAVPREGIAALDPVNGLPLSWNPGRSRGVGAQALFATSTGLWVGSDTTQIGGKTHGRIAFMPLAGGTTIPTVPAAQLPNNLFVAKPAAVPGAGTLQRRSVDANGAPTAASVTANTTIDWSTLRGAFYLNGSLYYGLADGRFYVRTFDPSTTPAALGPQQSVNLYDDPDNGARIPWVPGCTSTTATGTCAAGIAKLSGAFYDTATHRLYYTLSGDSHLYYRYFTPESRVVGAQAFVAVNNGVSFSTVSGMTYAGGRILYGSSTDGWLRSVTFGNGQVTGSPTVLSSDGTWLSTGMFVPN